MVKVDQLDFLLLAQNLKKKFFGNFDQVAKRKILLEYKIKIYLNNSYIDLKSPKKFLFAAWQVAKSDRLVTFCHSLKI